MNSVRFYKIREAAAIARLHPETVRRKIREGQIKPTILPSGSRLIHSDDLAAFLGISPEELPDMASEAESLAAYVRGVVDQAPPLTPAQKDRLRVLLSA